MALGFGGDVARYYAQYRRGYPDEVLDLLAESFALTARDRALDLGCGTGQLTVPLAARAGSVVGMDPEPDMLRLARESAAERGVGNVSWSLGADTDVPALGALLGGRSRLALTTVGQALHWMRHESLFRALRPLTRSGGGVAVVANGAPLWSQETEWSRALREALTRHFGRPPRASCGTAEDDRLRYAESLSDAGFADVHSRFVSYAAEMTFDDLIGGVYSAFSADLLPAEVDRPAFAEGIRRALPGEGPFTEQVRVSVLIGRAD